MNEYSDEEAPDLRSDTAREASVASVKSAANSDARQTSTPDGRASNEEKSSELLIQDEADISLNKENYLPTSIFERERQPYHRSSFPLDHARRRFPRDPSRGWQSDRNVSRPGLSGSIEKDGNSIRRGGKEYDKVSFTEGSTVYAEPAPIRRTSRGASGDDHLEEDYYTRERRSGSWGDSYGQNQYDRRYHPQRHSTRDDDDNGSWDESYDSQSSYSDDTSASSPRYYDSEHYIHRQPDIPVISSNPDDNGASLVERCDLSHFKDDIFKDYQDGGIRQAWLQKHLTLDDGIQTELAVINAAEGFVVEEGKSAVTLYCQKDATDDKRVKQGRIYWLHVQHTKDVRSVIQRLILSCHVNSHYKVLALSLLRGNSEQDTKRGRVADVARADDEPLDRVWDRQSVSFVSTPYFLFHETQSNRADSSTLQPLFRSQYGNGAGSYRDKLQVLPETQRWLGKERIHVGWMKSLLIGPEVLLTWSELPISAICKDNILFDHNNSHPLVTLRITDFHHHEHCSHVEQGISFAELNARIKSLLNVEHFEIFEDKERGRMLTPTLWAELLLETSTTLADIRLHVAHKRFNREPSPERYYGQKLLHFRSASRVGKGQSSLYSDIPRGSGNPRSRSRSATSLNATTGAVQLYRRQSTHSSDGRRPYSRPPSEREGNRQLALVRRSSTPNTGSKSRYRRAPRLAVLREYSTLKRKSSSDNGEHLTKPLTDMLVDNELEGRTRTKQAYDLSSSENESEIPQTSKRQPSAARWRHWFNTRKSNGDFKGTNLPRNDNTREEHTRPQIDGEASWREALKSLEDQTTPFLMWRVTGDDTGDNTTEGSFSAMIRLFKRIDDSLNDSARYGNLYKSGYRCSMADLKKRHTALARVSPKPKAENLSTGNEQNNSPIASEASKTAEERTQGLNGPSGNTIGTDEGTGTVYVSMIEPAEAIINSIFSRSRDILGLFVPLEPGLQADTTGVLGRYWGALDILFRILRFSAVMQAAEGEQSWRIRGSCRRNEETAAQGVCQACDDKAEYTLIDALQHLHTNDLISESHPIPQRAREDACFAWLEHTKIPGDNAHFNDLAAELEKFRDDLDGIWTLCRNLHLFIARPGVSQEGKRGDSTEQSHHSNQGSSSDSQSSESLKGVSASNIKKQSQAPALPGSLLQAFEHIITLFSLEARALVLMMRDSESTRVFSDGPAFRARREYEIVAHKATQCIIRSRDNLVRSIIEEDDDAVRLGAVGPEYIVILANSNLQTGIYCHKKDSERHQVSTSTGIEIRIGTERRVETFSSSIDETKEQTSEAAKKKTRTQLVSTDLIALYKEHASALDFSASIDPQRRAFLAIRAFEEELKAIRRVAAIQYHSVEDMLRIIEPRSFRSMAMERLTRFAFEQTVGVRAKRERMRERDEIREMQELMADLRQRVVEGIEVLDEGHEKAIRVFTLVTLFFLPLSFVTGFFGMNTVDVRDMTHSSRLYWAVAIPITVLTFGLAYLYGYKWEELTRLLKRKSWLEKGIVLSSRDVRVSGRVSTESSFAKLRRRYRGRRSRTIERQQQLEDYDARYDPRGEP